MNINALAISDILIPSIYNPRIRETFQATNLVISCGDLPYYYLEYILSTLDIPLFFVRGNHDSLVEHGSGGPRQGPLGAIDLHRQVRRHQGLLLAGVEGCLRYNQGNFQYTQAEMWTHVLRLVPGLLWNRVRFGRFLDIFVSHAPPWQVNDQKDRPHQGIKAFRWLVITFQPAFHFHGHIHLIHPGTPAESQLGRTQVLNSYGYRRAQVKVNRPPRSEQGHQVETK